MAGKRYAKEEQGLGIAALLLITLFFVAALFFVSSDTSATSALSLRCDIHIPSSASLLNLSVFSPAFNCAVTRDGNSDQTSDCFKCYIYGMNFIEKEYLEGGDHSGHDPEINLVSKPNGDFGDGDASSVVDEETPVTSSKKPKGSKWIQRITLLPEEHMSYAHFGAVYINNETKYSVNVQNLLEQPLSYEIKKDEPLVLILHAHATEGYTAEGINYYWPNEKSPTTIRAYKNMVAVGDVIANQLEALGIPVIHSVEQYNNPVHSNGYANAAADIKEYLKKYPSIKIIIDVHRDSVFGSSGTKYATVTDIEGKSAAQIMLLMGTGSSTQPNSHWKENLALAVKVQAMAEEMYPTLMRPILLRETNYNQNLSTGAMLVEIGTCGNTIEEAKYSAALFASVLAEVIKS